MATNSRADARHQQPDLERAIRVAITHPEEALKFIDNLLGDPFALFAQMSDVERDFLWLTLQRHKEKPLDAAEQSAALDVLVELTERRMSGDIPMNRREHRRVEGLWGFSRLLIAFAKASGLQDPGYDNNFAPYAEQVCRDVLARNGWVPPDTTGAPLSSWPAADRAMLLSVWPQKTSAPISKPDNSAPLGR